MLVLQLARQMQLLLLMTMTFVVCKSESRQADTIYYQINEEEIPGYRIGDLSEDAKLGEIYDARDLNQLRFRLLSSRPVNLTVGERSGYITTNGRLDREHICTGMPNCELKLDIAVSVDQGFRIIKVILEILDVNDNSPTFERSILRFRALESSPIDSTMFRIDEAIDPDTSINSVQQYVLYENNQDTWRLDVHDRIDGEKDVKLKLVKALDRETTPNYQLKVMAYDGGTTRRSGSVDIFIEVEDANDNIPVFERASYEITVDENIPPLTAIAQIRATDADEGDNGKIFYSFSSRSASSFGSLFSINSRNGTVFVTGVVDFEETDVYRLTVIARDQGPGSVDVAVPLIINVRDLNDHPPLITVSTFEETDTNTSSIKEDDPVDTFVAHVRVEDPDTGLGGRFSCGLVHPAFRLESSSGDYRIISSIKLDREEEDSYNLMLTCTDEGTPARSTTKMIHVSVSDINDNAPVFKKRTYSAGILENNYVGAEVVRVNATDADSGQNAKISYSLFPSDSEKFEINARTGVLKAIASLDREVQSLYRLEVQATDHGQPPKNTSVLVVVSILDVNDEAPQFNSTEYSFGIDENEPPGTYVGALSAVDNDGSDNNRHTYSLMPGGSLSGAFRIDPNDGRVTTTRRLDRERQSVYHLIAVAQDTESRSLSSTVGVSIFVMDKNDNKPNFIFPTRNNYTVQLSTRVPLGSHVTRVRAHDIDELNNGKVRYRITSGNNEGIFTIEPVAGTILVNIDLRDYKTNRTFRLEITASDQGKPAQSTSATLRIVLNDSIPFSKGADGRGMFSGDNFFIVVAVGCGSGALIIILLIVIVVMLRRQHLKRHRVTRYNCRMQALQRLAQQDMQKLDHNPKPKDTRKVSDADYVMLPKADPADDYVDIHGRMDCAHTKSRHWLENVEPNIYETTPRRHDDNFSTKSMEGSNTDSGRGHSDGDPDNGHSHKIPVPIGHEQPPSYQSLPAYQPPRYTRSSPQCQTFTSFRSNDSNASTPTDSIPRPMSPQTSDSYSRTLPTSRTAVTPTGSQTIAIKPQGSPVFASKKAHKPSDSVNNHARLGTFKEECSHKTWPDRETDC